MLDSFRKWLAPPPAPSATEGQRVAQAGSDIYRAVCDSIADGRGVHLETAIAAAGYLAGTAVLKSCGINLSALSPGAPVFVDKVNEIGPMVVEVMMGVVARGEQKGAADLKSPPADIIPHANEPQRTYEDLVRLLWPKLQTIVEQQSLSPQIAPFACARAAAEMVLAGQTHLDPAIGKAIAVTAMVKASKTVPVV